MVLDQKTIQEYTDAVVRGEAPDLHVPRDACLAEGNVDSCGIVIFGATGDLTVRKLAPALYNLYFNGGMPEPFFILGTGRHELSREEFISKIRPAAGSEDLSKWDDFARHVSYRQVDVKSLDSFGALSERLNALSRDHGTAGNKLFYLAVPPSLYGPIAGMLGSAGLAAQGDNGRPWARLVVEKPFGRDLESARELNVQLAENFDESQIFRIDHYLAKETVQNALIFRFANAIFEPLWDRNYIDHIHITAVESLGVEMRAGYYEESGVLRDMFQNHMMQLLAITAMEPPAHFEAELVRDEKCKVFRSLRPLDVESMEGQLVLGQYVQGTANGTSVRGYREESGVDPNSLTPTFAMLKVFVDNWRWQGVPFYLTSGKRLAKKQTEISIHFKPVPHTLFRNVLDENIKTDRLTMGIYPNESIHLTFQTKNPGATVCLRSVDMNFNYLDNYTGPILDAYEKSILDAIQGNQMLFWRQDAVELCWQFLDPILDACEDCDDRARRLHFYAAGTQGPDAAKDWLD